MPEFESGYVQPQATTPPARAVVLQAVDISILFLALVLASVIALKRRRRREMLLLTLFSLLYFGFWRRGCVCPVGSFQNVAAALTDSAYAVPFSVIAIFLLPLVFALMFGRVFCSGVCPLGAIQELVVWRPVRVPRWLAKPLGLLPYLYLGLAVLCAATGAGFLVCRFDPFVGFFRLGGSFGMIVTGVVLLLLGAFVARPYCRFICPYGLLLNWMSQLSWRHVTITPDECVQCRLCEDACPYDAILVPPPKRDPEPRRQGVRRLALLLVLVPLLVGLGGWCGSRLHVPLSRLHPLLRLAERVNMEDTGAVAGGTLESQSFRSAGYPSQDLFEQAQVVRGRFHVGSALLGTFIGLAVSLQLVGLSVYRTRRDYVPDRGGCVSCTRCFSYCPRERVRRSAGEAV